MATAGNILVIDDDDGVRAFVCDAAAGLGLPCTATSDPRALPELLVPDTTLILLDLMMPGMDGIEVMRSLAARQCKARIVLMSGIGERVLETAEKLALSLGLCLAGHLQKPFRLAELELVLRGHAPSQTVTPQEPPPSLDIPEEEVRRAVEREEFVLHYQPQIEIATGSVCGLEALARWQHPQRGLIFPDNFIGRIEALGLIDRFGWLMVNRGLSEAKQFVDQAGQMLRMALNASVDSLRDLRFPDTFAALLEKYGVAAERVVIEITETGLIKELNQTLDVLTRLRVKNIQLSIDDFGTGYAVMQQLRNIPANELKIDRTFVMHMLSNGSDRVMVQKTIEIGHELGMSVIAEGVETDAQLDFLRWKGCDQAQGYLISRPLAPQKLAAWLKDYRPCSPD
jgi:EAL domain-containing protein (putative c-di-GMP-specific phosphodiesterase class I)